MEVVGKHQERFVGERIVMGGSSRPSSMEASHKKHRLHIKVGKEVEEEELLHISTEWLHSPLLDEI